MKNFKLKIGALLASAAMMVAVSCSDEFLEIPPVGELAEAQLSSLAGLDAALIAAYSQVNGRGNRLGSPSNWVWGSIRGGEANKGTDPVILRLLTQFSVLKMMLPEGKWVPSTTFVMKELLELTMF